MGQRPITRWLSRAPTAAFGLYAIAAAFLTYFSMYAFRKPFAAGEYTLLNVPAFDIAIPYEFSLVPGLAMPLKDALIISQVLGYALSKYLGVKFVTEFGIIVAEPGEIVIIPKGVRFRVELVDGPVRGYV